MSEINYYGDVSRETAGYWSAQLLKRGQRKMFLERFGQFDPQPKNKSKVRNWRRYTAFNPAIAPLAEGVTPSGQKLTKTDYTATLEQYGDLAWVTDVITDTTEDPVINDTVNNCSQQLAETVELIRWNVLKAGTNVFYANNVAGRSTVNSPPIRGDLRKIVRAFNRNRATKLTEIVSASPKISTQPVEAAFWALCSTDLESDIRGLTGFIPVAQYGDSMKSLPGELGTVEEIRFLTSSLYEPFSAAGASGTTYLSGGVAVSSAASCDVYPIIIIAKDAYGIVPLQGMDAVDIGIKSPGEKTVSDPLGQKGFVSWKTYQTAAILNQLWIARYEVACTANPA